MSAVSPARLAWAETAGAASALYHALDETNLTRAGWACDRAAAYLRQAAEHAAPQHLAALIGLACRVEYPGDGRPLPDAELRSLMDEAFALAGVLEAAMLVAEAVAQDAA